MSFEIKISEKILFLKDQGIESRTFLQSEKYAQFRENLDEKIIRWEIHQDQKIIGTVLIQQVETRFKSFLHCPHGPLLDFRNRSAWKFFLSHYKDLGKSLGMDFVRISPLLEPKIETEAIFKAQNFRPAPLHLVNPEKNWILDITKPEEEILAQMRKSTRYEIRRIEKCGISVQSGNGKKDLDIFWNLHSETVKRQRFTPFPRSNTEKQLETFGDNCLIFSSKIEDEFYSSAIIIFDEKSAYYHQGASRHHKFPVAHAPLWKAIKEAKKRGCTVFNFWGVVNEDQKKHPWYGLSKFKRGFGGYEVNYLHCQDFPLTSKYWLNYGIEKFRKWKKGY